MLFYSYNYFTPCMYICLFVIICECVFIGDMLSVPVPPAFANPSTVGATILNGVNYASSAAGILDDTGRHYVPSMH